MSTCSVDDLVAALGIDKGSPSRQVLADLRRARQTRERVRNRALGHISFVYVYSDATYVHVRDDALGQIVSHAVVVATGVKSEDRREVLGVDIGDSEDNVLDRVPPLVEKPRTVW